MTGLGCKSLIVRGGPYNYLRRSKVILEIILAEKASGSLVKKMNYLFGLEGENK